MAEQHNQPACYDKLSHERDTPEETNHSHENPDNHPDETINGNYNGSNGHTQEPMDSECNDNTVETGEGTEPNNLQKGIEEQAFKKQTENNKENGIQNTQSLQSERLSDSPADTKPEEGQDGDKSNVDASSEDVEDGGDYTEFPPGFLPEAKQGLPAPQTNDTQRNGSKRKQSDQPESPEHLLPMKGEDNLVTQLGVEVSKEDGNTYKEVEAGTEFSDQEKEGLQKRMSEDEKTSRKEDVPQDAAGQPYKETLQHLNTETEKKEELRIQSYEEVEALNKKVVQYERTIGEQEKQLEDLTTQLTTQMKKNKELQSQLRETNGELEEKVAQHEHTVREKEKQLEVLTTQLTTQMQQNKELQSQLGETARKLKKLQNAMKEQKDANNKHQGQVKVLNDNIKTLTQENKRLEKRATDLDKQMGKEVKAAQDSYKQLEKSYKDYETKCHKASSVQATVIAGLQKDAKELKRKAKEESENCQKTSKAFYDLQDRTRELEVYAKDVIKVHAETEQLKRDVASKTETIQVIRNDVKALQEENKRLSDSLSKEWSTKVSSDETNTENISVSNRPMKIRTEYENMCSDEWLEAKTELDELEDTDEEQRRMFLCDILMKAEKCASKYYEERMASLTHFLSQPLTHMVVSMEKHSDDRRRPQDNKQSSSDTAPYPKDKPPSEVVDAKCKTTVSLPMELKNALGDFLRTNADKTDMTRLIMDLSAQLTTEWEKYLSRISSILEMPCVKKYISVCSLLAWKMITQRPQMNFSDEGVHEKYNEKTQEPNFGSDDPQHKNAVVMYYVHPALYHSSNLLVKGRVVIKLII